MRQTVGHVQLRHVYETYINKHMRRTTSCPCT